MLSSVLDFTGGVKAMLKTLPDVSPLKSLMNETDPLPEEEAGAPPVPEEDELECEEDA